ncbi:MAG: hypothetical protein OXO48_18495 [Caldilineaceae bacterium]|nr:hypothetical protein [Caldilineaceae bacterium]
MELQTKQPPELEFSMPEVEESLTAYLSAIGGAVIGLLLTLLVLAIWNGGTLNFTNTSKVNAIEAGLTDVAQDVEAVNANLADFGERLVVLEQEAGAVAELEQSFAALDTSLSDLDQSLNDQGIQVAELDAAVADLEATRRNFELFISALTQALTQMESGSVNAQRSQPARSALDTSRSDARQGAETDRAAASSSDSPARPSAAGPQPTILLPPQIVNRQDIAPDALLVYLFVDADTDGLYDSDENFIAGATVTLVAPDGAKIMTIAPVASAGTLLETLQEGKYTVSVEDVHGYSLASLNNVSVTVDPTAESGQVIYFAVVTSVSE